MGCTEYDRLIDEAAKLLGAERAIIGQSANSLSTIARSELQAEAHAQVILAEYDLNRHIDECPTCRATHKEHVLLTHSD